MNNRSKKIYLVILDNKAVLFETTLRGLSETFNNLSAGTISYITLFRKFKDGVEYFSVKDGEKEYFFQRIEHHKRSKNNPK